MTATEILRSFKHQGETYLTKKDIEFCQTLIRDGIVGVERVDAVSRYILDNKKSELRREGLDAAEHFGNYFENYLTVSQGLLFSHKGIKPTQPYYRPASEDFKSVIVVLPDKKLLIKSENFENAAWYGERRDKSGTLIVVKVYTLSDTGVWNLLYDGSFIDVHYPRFSMYCMTPCWRYNQRSMFIELPDELSRPGREVNEFKAECFMSRNRSALCGREEFSEKTYGLQLLDYYAIAVESFERWRNRPRREGTKKTESYNDHGVCALTVETPPGGNIRKQEFKEIKLKEYHSYVSSRRLMGWKVENRLSPCEHERREHTRVLSSGKTVTVRKAIVNKGSGKAVYKID